MTTAEAPPRTPSPRTTRLLTVILVLLATVLTGCPRVAPKPPTDLSRLQGHWQGTGPGGPCAVTIADDTLRFHARDDFWFETEFTLITETDPRQLHATIVRESDPEATNVGTVVVALFGVEGNALRLGVVDDFEGAPTDEIVGDWDWVMDLYEFKRAVQ